MFAGGFSGWVRALAGAIVLAAVLTPGHALAAELAFRAPASCASADTVREQVGKLVGRRLDGVEGIDFEIEIEATAAGAFVLRLRAVPIDANGARGAARERTLEGASCAEVTDAASVAMALAIAERDEERTRQESAPAAQPTTPAAAPPPAEADAAGPSFGVSLGLGALVESGALPALALGAELQAALHYGVLRVALLGALFAPQSGELEDGSGGARFDFVLGGLLVCGTSRIAAPLNLLACAGMELGRLAAEGEDVTRMRSGDALWYAPRVDLGLGYALSDAASVLVRAGAAVPLARPEFVINDADRVHQPGNVSARLLLGFSLRL